MAESVEAGETPATGGATALESAFADKAGEKEATDGATALESAFADKAGEKAADGVDGKALESDGAKSGKDAAAELAAMSDEDYAAEVLPDGEDGKTPPGRDFIQDLAGVCREAGVSPAQLKAIYARFNEVIDAKTAALKEADEAKAREAKEAAVAAFDDDAWKSILAAGRRYATPGSDLERLLAGKEGSNKGLLQVLKDLGDTLRSDTSSTTGAAGSSRSLDSRLFESTVPKGLR